METTKRPSRRSLLRAAIAFTGVAGTGLAAKLAPFGGSDGSTTLRSTDGEPNTVASATLYLDRYTMHTGGGLERQKGDQTLLRGTLLSGGGDSVGELFSSAITMPGPVEPDAPRSPRLEIQNFQLADGNILGMGTTFSNPDISNVYTVFGGSGRYSGARGSYTFDDNPSVAKPDGQATVNFDLVV